MISKIKYIRSRQFNPYLNLALEEYLLDNVKEDECILYLWQNERTVVIGRNQNPWKECKVRELEEDGGYLVRRLSGGGAVFHDLGNLNFTFLVQKDNYDVDKQLEVIIRALKNMGIPALKSGRNDITVEDRKFSGNAFYFDGSQCYHHGTLLVNVNMEDLSRYLNVSRDKLKSKGVDSVRSRVTNLVNYKDDLTIEVLCDALVDAFSQVYGLPTKELSLDDIDVKDIEFRKDRFKSWDWLFGSKIPFVYNIDKRFPWGNFEIQINADKGKITQCKVFSDSMDIDIIENIPKALIGVVFSSSDIVKAIRSYMDEHVTSKDNQYDFRNYNDSTSQEEFKQSIIDDICKLILLERL